MKFKKSIYPIINGKMEEHYEETSLSNNIRDIIERCIGNIANDVKMEKEKLENQFENHINGVCSINNIKKMKYDIKIESLSTMTENEFNNLSEEIKTSLVKKKAIESLLCDKKIEISIEGSVERGFPSNADIEIDISHDEGNSLVYIYDLYFNNTFKRLDN